MRTLYFYLFFITTLIYSVNTFSQTTFYEIDSIQKMEIYFSQTDWDYELDTSKSGNEDYIMADSILINGIVYDSVGVKYKGNSSYNSSNLKNPIHIALDEYKSHDYQGFKDIKLGNGYSDPSMIREVLAYSILGNYMDCPRSNFAQLYINGSYIGVYSNDEAINKKFISEHFYSSNNTFIKCNPIVNPSPTTKSNLKNIPSTDSTAYYNFYEIKSNNGWTELQNLTDTITNVSGSIDSEIDMDRAIWMLAFNNVTVNLDSYTGVFAQNYYLYKDNTNRFNPIIWDLNMALGGFPYVGSGTSSMGTLTNTNMEQLSPSIHSGDSNWPLINAVLTNPMYKRMYIAHMKTISEEIFSNDAYQTLAAQMQATIDTAVQSDLNKFYTYSQFQNGLTLNTVVGSYTVTGIANLMEARMTYLQSTPEFNFTTPEISAISTSVTNPNIGSTFDITATIINTNSNTVYLGYRFNYTDRFTRILMYDDGNHNDGLSGDDIYGTSLSMLAAEGQYYIYAENDDAGMFSPQRAEHEFYSIYANVQITSIGEIVINEFLASNQNDATDEQNQHDDWIEFYNLTNNSLSLSGLHLSDDISNLSKYTFPANTIIPANGFLIVWADQDNSTSTEIHCNFKLSSTADIILLSDSLGIIYDSISFGIQTTDISIGRCPNGTGNFETQIITSINTTNCYDGLIETDLTNEIQIYPNPSTGYFNVSTDKTNNYSLQLIDNLGNTIETKNIIDGNTIEFKTGKLSSGIYFLKIESSSNIFISNKISILNN